MLQMTLVLMKKILFFYLLIKIKKVMIQIILIKTFICVLNPSSVVVKETNVITIDPFRRQILRLQVEIWEIWHNKIKIII